MSLNNISGDEANSLISKCMSEHLAVLLYVKSASQMQVIFPGYVDSVTVAAGLIISASSPPTNKTGYICVPIFNRPAEFSYGEKKELPSAVLSTLDSGMGESCLAIKFLDTGDFIAVIFTVD